MCFQEYEEAEAIGLEDALKMQVKRYMLEKWINEPFFEATLTGCMVRVSIGRGTDAGYVAAEITGVEERPPGKYRQEANSLSVCPLARTLMLGLHTNLVVIAQLHQVPGERSRGAPSRASVTSSRKAVARQPTLQPRSPALRRSPLASPGNEQDISVMQLNTVLPGCWL